MYSADDINDQTEWLPNIEMSSFVDDKYHRWHVQTNLKSHKSKKNNIILFIHGLGSSVTTWRDILPIYKNKGVFAIDLPGHGMTRLKTQGRSSLSIISSDIKKLLEKNNIRPSGIVGHSSGAAIALNLASTLGNNVDFVISINGSFENFNGLPGIFFPMFAKILSAIPFSGQIFSRLNRNHQQVKRLLEMTGSILDERGIDLYKRLISNPAHVSGTIGMMAQWNHRELMSMSKEFSGKCLFITGENDKIVHPDVSLRESKKIKNAKMTCLKNLGHLMHEESPREIYNEIDRFLKEFSHPNN